MYLIRYIQVVVPCMDPIENTCTWLYALTFPTISTVVPSVWYMWLLARMYNNIWCKQLYTSTADMLVKMTIIYTFLYNGERLVGIEDLSCSLTWWRFSWVRSWRVMIPTNWNSKGEELTLSTIDFIYWKVISIYSTHTIGWSMHCK